jgi:carboxypeptidase Q
MEKLLSLFIFLFLSIASRAQNADSIAIKKLADEILTNGEAYENLRFLCKKIGPRLSGSPQAQKAVEATAKMLREAGADTVYLQPCMVPHWVRGKKEKGFIALENGKKITLNLCALGNSVGTGAKGVNASVIEVNSVSTVACIRFKKLKNKIVFFNFPMNPAHINTFAWICRDCAYQGEGARRWLPNTAPLV